MTTEKVRESIFKTKIVGNFVLWCLLINRYQQGLRKRPIKIFGYQKPDPGKVSAGIKVLGTIIRCAWNISEQKDVLIIDMRPLAIWKATSWCLNGPYVSIQSSDGKTVKWNCV